MWGKFLESNTVIEALRDTKKSKAPGYDRLVPNHLHYLDPMSLRYLTDTIHLSENSGKIPNIWKVIPLHKPVKDRDKPESFRSIEFLSPIAKLTKKFLLSDFMENPL